MKQISKLIAPALVVAAAFAAPLASALPPPVPVVFDPAAQYQGPYTYVGVLNPGLFDTAGVTHGQIAGGTFTDFWVFDINPSGNGSASLTFQPSTTISGLSVTLYKALPGGTCALNGLNQAAACSVLPGLGALVPTTNSNSPNNFAQAISNGFLAAGRYIVEFTGSNSAVTGSYGGAIATNNVPEPGTLALVGAALLGAAVSLRKRKSV